MKNGYNTTGSAVLYPFICLKFICRYVVVKKMPGSEMDTRTATALRKSKGG